MTWCKLGEEFFDQCARAGLSDAATRTHTEVVCWLYRIDNEDVADTTVPKHLLRRIAGSDQYEIAAKDLCEIGYWRDNGDHWTVLHHADVIAESLTAQRNRKESNRKAQERSRAKSKADVSADTHADVSADMSTDVNDDISAEISAWPRQTDRQTDKQLRESTRTITRQRYCYACGGELADDYRGDYCSECDPWNVPPQTELGGGVA